MLVVMKTPIETEGARARWVYQTSSDRMHDYVVATGIPDGYGLFRVEGSVHAGEALPDGIDPVAVEIPEASS